MAREHVLLGLVMGCGTVIDRGVAPGAPPTTPAVELRPIARAVVQRVDDEAHEEAHARDARARESAGRRSKQLPNGLYNPMPNGVMAGYAADTGLDIAGYHLPV